MLDKPMEYNGLVLNDMTQRGRVDILTRDGTIMIDPLATTPGLITGTGTAWSTYAARGPLFLYVEYFVQPSDASIRAAELAGTPLPEAARFNWIAKVDRIIDDTHLVVEGDLPTNDMLVGINYTLVELGTYIKIRSISGLDDAETREERTARAGQDGEVASDQFLSGRSITLSGEIVGVNFSHLRYLEDLVKATFADGQEHDLIFHPRGRGRRRVSCRKNQKLEITEEQTDDRKVRAFTINLRAADPVIYGLDNKSVTQSQVATSLAVRSYSEEPEQSDTMDRLVRLSLDGSVSNSEVSEYTLLSAGVTPTNPPEYILGQFGQALRWISPSNYYLDVKLPAPVTLSKGWGISAWVKPEAFLTGGNRTRLAYVYDANGTGFSLLEIDGTGRLIIGGTGTLSSRNTNDSTALLPLNEWTHVEVSWNRATRSTRIFLNGSLDKIIKYSTQGTEIVMQYLNIFGGTSRQLVGSLDEYALYHGPVAARKTIRSYPRTYPDYPSSTDTGLAINEGSYKSYPTTEIWGPIVNPILHNAATGESIIFRDKQIAANNYISIDHRTGVIKDNGIALNYTGVDVSRSRFWALHPHPTAPDGWNHVQLLATSADASQGAKAVIRWSDAYA